MSYMVEVIRPISKREVQALVDEDPELTIAGEGEHWMDLTWSKGESTEILTFAQGRFTLTTPNEATFAKAQELAEKLGAQVIGEEEQIPERPVTPVTGGVSVTWAGWPIMVIVLVGLLIWKW